MTSEHCTCCTAQLPSEAAELFWAVIEPFLQPAIEATVKKRLAGYAEMVSNETWRDLESAVYKRITNTLEDARGSYLVPLLKCLSDITADPLTYEPIVQLEQKAGGDVLRYTTASGGMTLGIDLKEKSFFFYKNEGNQGVSDYSHFRAQRILWSIAEKLAKEHRINPSDSTSPQGG